MRTMEERTGRWVQFADPSSRVNRLIVINVPEDMPPGPMPWWECMAEWTERSYMHYEKQLEHMEWLDDDAVPCLRVGTGTEIFAEAFGCRVHKPSDSNPFALPMILDASEIPGLKVPKLEDTRLTLLFDMADKLRARAGRDALFGLPDLQSPLDVAALIWEKTEFFPAMIEQPEAVEELSGKVKELMFAFLDEWFRRYGTACVAHYPDYYFPRGVSLSIDEIGSFSAGMYKRFVAPELASFRDRYGALGLHCCADSRHQWENIRDTEGLILLNLVRDEAQTVESMEFFQGSVALYQNTYVADCGTADPEKLHVAFLPFAESKDDALRILDQFHKDWR